MNVHAFELINGWAGHNAALDAVMVFAATALLFLVAGVVGVLVGHTLFRRRWLPLLQTGLALAVAFTLNLVLGALNHEARPFQDHHAVQLIAHDASVSLPSDHATAGFTLALATTLFLQRWFGVGLIVASVAIGVSRIWVGVHYPGDVLASFVIAVVAVLSAVVAGRVLGRRRPQRSSTVDEVPSGRGPGDDRRIEPGGGSERKLRHQG